MFILFLLILALLAGIASGYVLSIDTAFPRIVLRLCGYKFYRLRGDFEPKCHTAIEDNGVLYDVKFKRNGDVDEIWRKPVGRTKN